LGSIALYSRASTSLSFAIHYSFDETKVGYNGYHGLNVTFQKILEEISSNVERRIEDMGEKLNEKSGEKQDFSDIPICEDPIVGCSEAKLA
jgi:hypothetical protein